MTAADWASCVLLLYCTYLCVNRLCNLHWLELINENWQDKGTKTKRSRCRVVDFAAAVRQRFHCYVAIVEKRRRRNVVLLVFVDTVLLHLGKKTCLFRVSRAPSKPTPVLIIHPTGWDWRNPLGFMTSFSIRCTGKSSEWLQHLTLTVSRLVNTYQTCQRFKTPCRHLLSWTVVCRCSCLCLMLHSPNIDCNIQVNLICVDFFLQDYSSNTLRFSNTHIYNITFPVFSSYSILILKMSVSFGFQSCLRHKRQHGWTFHFQALVK